MRHDPTNAKKPSATPDELIIDSPFYVEWTHRLRFTRDALNPDNAALVEAIRADTNGNGTRGMIAVIDDGLAQANPSISDDLNNYCAAYTELPELREVIQVPGGEQCKQDDKLVQRVLDAIDQQRICRKSTVLVLGGGAVLDAAGYAAAIGHRGVRIVRMPSTVLSQCDSGVGVKNGINRANKKNFVGTFAPPWAVLCDTGFLTTLDERDWLCGFSEIVKIGLLRDKTLLDELERNAAAIVARELEPAIPLIERSAHLHLKHITEGGDPFELKEARPLDFGHWSAHKIEQMTNFKLRHGDAVSVGLALDLVYSKIAGIINSDLAERSLNLLESLNLPISNPSLEQTDKLLEGIQEFREHLGGQLTITLVTDAGRPLEVHEIDANLVREAISHLMARSNQ